MKRPDKPVWARILSRVMTTGFAGLLPCACLAPDPADESGEPKPEIKDTDPKFDSNSNEPVDNSEIAAERFFGQLPHHSDISKISGNDLDGFYFAGYLNSRSKPNGMIIQIGLPGDSLDRKAGAPIVDLGYVVGEISEANLEKEWTIHPDFRIRALLKMDDPKSELYGSIIYAGAKNFRIDSVNSSWRAFVSIYNRNDATLRGTLIGQVDSWLNSINETASDSSGSRYVAVGGISLNNVAFPYLLEFRVEKSSGSIALVRDSIFFQVGDAYAANYYFVGSTILPNSSSARIAISAEPEYQGDFRIFFLDSALAIKKHWKIDAFGPNRRFRTGLDCLIKGDGRVFLSGYFEDVKKTTGSTSGDYWHSGLAMGFDYEGNFLWGREISLSEYSDFVFGIGFIDGSLYAVGESSSLVKSGKNKLGNGMLVKIDPATGQMVRTMSFGNKQYASRFYSISGSGRRIHLSGFSQHRTDDGGKLAWLITLK